MKEILHSLRIGLSAGLVAGLVSTLYRMTINHMSTWRAVLYDFPVVVILIFSLLAGLAVASLVKWAPFSYGTGTPQVKNEIRGSINMPTGPTVVAKFVGGSISNLVGLSLGREGPSIEMGALLAKRLGRKFSNKRTWLLAGAAAGIGAAFNAPLAGTLFALSENKRQIKWPTALTYLLASITACWISFILEGQHSFYSFELTHQLPLVGYVWMLVIGIVGGILGRFFNDMVNFMGEWRDRLPLNNAAILVLIFLASALIGIVFPHIMGGGKSVVEYLSQHYSTANFLLSFLFLKLTFTALSLTSGAPGGKLTPAMVIGATVGAIVFHYAGLELDYLPNFVASGILSLMSSAIHPPLVSIIFVVEMTYSPTHIIPYFLVSLISYSLSRKDF